MEFSKEFGQFFILGDSIQRASPFKVFRLKDDIKSIQIIGHEAAKGAVAAIPGKDGLSRAAAGAVLGFLVAGPVGTVVGASAGASAPKGKAGRDATDERFTLLVEFINENPRVQTAYVSREELSQLAPYLSEPKKADKKEIQFDASRHVNWKTGTIYYEHREYGEKFNRELIGQIANNESPSYKLIEELVSYINSPIVEGCLDNRRSRVEKLYFALRTMNDSERSKGLFKRSIFDYSQLGMKFLNSKIDGDDIQLTEECDLIINQIYARLKKNINDDELDEFLRLHIVHCIDKNLGKFPTDFAMVNVAAIAPGSFFEDRAVLVRDLHLDELRLESARLRTLVEPNKFDKFLCRSVDSLHGASRGALEKISKKEILSASDISRTLQCCESLCFMADRDEVAYAEDSARTVLMKAQAGKRTKKIDEGIGSLQTFIEYPKGEFSDQLALYRLNIKRKSKSPPSNIRKPKSKEIHNISKNLAKGKLNEKENSNKFWSKVKNIFR